MTSNAYNYGKAPVKGEGMPVWEQGPRTPAEEIEMLNQQVSQLTRYRYIYNRLALIAREGNLMFNHPQQGFILVEDLETYMTEPL
jgi:hypothetical protein